MDKKNQLANYGSHKMAMKMAHVLCTCTVCVHAPMNHYTKQIQCTGIIHVILPPEKNWKILLAQRYQQALIETCMQEVKT